MAPDPFRLVSAADGIGAIHEALRQLGIDTTSFASEKEEHPMSVVRRRSPQTTHLGDIYGVDWTRPELQGADLYMASPPCVGVSRANPYGKGLRDNPSEVFWEAVRGRDRTNPKYWMFENVVPRDKNDLRAMTSALGVDPIYFDSADFGPSRRERLFWTNIPGIGPAPGSSEIALPYMTHTGEDLWLEPHQMEFMQRNHGGRTPYDRFTSVLWQDPKARTILSSARKGMPKNTFQFEEGGPLRFGHPEELEALLGFPRGYTEGIPNTWRLHTLGGTIDQRVLQHILKAHPGIAERMFQRGIAIPPEPSIQVPSRPSITIPGKVEAASPFPGAPPGRGFPGGRIFSEGIAPLLLMTLLDGKLPQSGGEAAGMMAPMMIPGEGQAALLGWAALNAFINQNPNSVRNTDEANAVARTHDRITKQRAYDEYTENPLRVLDDARQMFQAPNFMDFLASDTPRIPEKPPDLGGDYLQKPSSMNRARPFWVNQDEWEQELKKPHAPSVMDPLDGLHTAPSWLQNKIL